MCLISIWSDKVRVSEDASYHLVIHNVIYDAKLLIRYDFVAWYKDHGGLSAEVSGL